MEIKDIINEILNLEEYCIFNNATKSTFSETKGFFGNMPKDMQEFYKTFDGGLIFGQNFCSLSGKNDTYSFKELNDVEYKEMYYVPQDVIVFVDTGYGDLIGYDKNTNEIVQINPEQDEEEWIKWDNFKNYLTEFLDESKKLIDDKILEPLGRDD